MPMRGQIQCSESWWEPWTVRYKDLEVGVTLHVSGLIVSGLLISQNSYLRTLSELLRENGSSERQPAREALASAFELITDSIAGPETDPPSHIEVISANFSVSSMSTSRSPQASRQCPLV
jgi:hypothetical protein